MGVLQVKKKLLIKNMKIHLFDTVLMKEELKMEIHIAQMK